MEEWKNIDGSDGLYQVSDSGRIRSMDRLVHGNYKVPRLFKGKAIRTTTNPDGFICVNLTINGKIKAFFVHRLVASHFIENSQGLRIVTHIDGDKSNNVVENLGWTYKKGKSKLTENDVREIRRLSERGITAVKIAGIYGVGRNSVHGILNGRYFGNVI